MPLVEPTERHANVRLERWESGGGLSFRGREGEPFRRQLTEIVRYGRGAYDRRGEGLLLVDGSWLAGRVTEIGEDACRVVGRYFNTSIPRPLVRAALFSAPAIDGLQEEIIREAFAAEGSDDIVIGVDGDRRSGALQAAEESDVIWQRGEDELRLRSDARPLRIAVSGIRAVVFSPLLTPRVPADSPKMVVGLAGGSRLQVRRYGEGESATTVTLVCGAELVLPPPAEAAAAITYLSPSEIGGGEQTQLFRRLSDEPPLRLRVQPLFGPAYDAPPSEAAPGGESRSTVAGHWYGNTIAMPSASQAVYRGLADGGIFRAEVAIADSQVPDAAAGTARFRVLVVGREGQLREIWKSEPVRGGDGLIEVFVLVPPTAAVVLAVDRVESKGAGDRAVWIDPVLTAN